MEQQRPMTKHGNYSRARREAFNRRHKSHTPNYSTVVTSARESLNMTPDDSMKMIAGSITDIRRKLKDIESKIDMPQKP